MMRFDKSNSFCASVPQREDKNGNFGQKNDFSEVDHFFCTLGSLLILDFIFFFFKPNLFGETVSTNGLAGPKNW